MPVYKRISGVDLVELRTVAGYRYLLPKGMIPFQEDAIRECGVYEAATTAVIGEFVEPGMHVIEAGACCGYHALNIAGTVGGAGKVTCYEANPFLVLILQQNIELNGFDDTVTVNHAGLWQQSGVMPFPMLGSGLGGASFKSQAQLQSVPTVNVNMVTLDEQHGDERVNFIRMDIEGAEYEALQGARHILATQRPRLVLECIAGSENVDDCGRLVALLESSGYVIDRITTAGLSRVVGVEDLLRDVPNEHDRDILCRHRDSV